MVVYGEPEGGPGGEKLEKNQCEREEEEGDEEDEEERVERGRGEVGIYVVWELDKKGGRVDVK